MSTLVANCLQNTTIPCFVLFKRWMIAHLLRVDLHTWLKDCWGLSVSKGPQVFIKCLGPQPLNTKVLVLSGLYITWSAIKPLGSSKKDVSTHLYKKGVSLWALWSMSTFDLDRLPLNKLQRPMKTFSKNKDPVKPRQGLQRFLHHLSTTTKHREEIYHICDHASVLCYYYDSHYIMCNLSILYHNKTFPFSQFWVTLRLNRIPCRDDVELIKWLGLQSQCNIADYNQYLSE